MYSESDLEGAVAAGIISSTTADAFRQHIATARATPAVDEESFRLLTGFNDIFVGIAIALLLAALAQLGDWFNHALAGAAVAVHLLGQPLPERVGPVRAEPRRTPAGPPRQQPGIGATPPRGQVVPRRPASVPATPLPKRPTGVPRRAKNPDQNPARGNPDARSGDYTYGGGPGPAGYATPPGGGQGGPFPRAGEDKPWR